MADECVFPTEEPEKISPELRLQTIAGEGKSHATNIIPRKELM
jgi:hypothetical protein